MFEVGGFVQMKVICQAQNEEHYSWIQEVQHLALEPKIYIIAVFCDISWDSSAIWRIV